jgi:hypothetical protein
MDTQKADLQAVVEPLGKLARQNRKFRVAGLVAPMLVGAVVLIAAVAAPVALAPSGSCAGLWPRLGSYHHGHDHYHRAKQ